jgi:hypothetical protein
MAATETNLIETTAVYAKTNAVNDPDWIYDGRSTRSSSADRIGWLMTSYTLT